MIELLIEAERALSSGTLDRADQLYRQVADADPHNSIAVVGLGRVALERGDDLGAYMLARRALTIDPENEAARRLAARLEEALATRGEPVADAVTDTTDGAATSGGAATGGATTGSAATGGALPADHVARPSAQVEMPSAPPPAAMPLAEPLPPGAWSPPTQPSPGPPADGPRHRSRLDRLLRRGR